jgi:hypothetical protein
MVPALLQAEHVLHLIALHRPDPHQSLANSFFHGGPMIPEPLEKGKSAQPAETAGFRFLAIPSPC